MGFFLIKKVFETYFISKYNFKLKYLIQFIIEKNVTKIHRIKK